MRFFFPGISLRDCHLINGCWLDSECLYPLPSGSIKTKSTSIMPEFDINLFGKPQCAPLNENMKNEIFLNSYHACLQAGCSSNVDDLKVIEHLLGYGAAALPNRLQPQFFALTLTGHIRADNYKDYIRNLLPNNHLLFNSILNQNHSKSGNKDFSLPFTDNDSNTNKKFVGPDVRNLLLRPALPCPFQNLNWPNIPQLSGNFKGCCETPLCYLPRISIKNARSEIASYETSWKSWTVCSATCGRGVQTRRRFCIGEGCQEPQVETRSCILRPCPITLYSPWSEYGACSASCGGGLKIRKRSCALPNLCTERMQETARCRTGRCPTIRYGQWSRCSRTCGFGIQRRSGRCEHPGDYGCPKNVFQERRCEQFCGHIRYRESHCDRSSCLITRIPECVLGNGRPGHCRKSKNRPTTRKCYQGRCLCFHRPFLNRCRRNK